MRRAIFRFCRAGFYLTFWQLSMYDLVPPAARYDEECAALRTLSRQEDSKYIAADRSADRTKRLSASSHRAKRDRYNTFVNTLAQEFKEQTASRVFTMKRLAREKQHWFAHSKAPSITYSNFLTHVPAEHRASVLASAIIEHCIQPRCLLSPMDADFCAQFIKVMHTQGTPRFHTLQCYDKVRLFHAAIYRIFRVGFSCLGTTSRQLSFPAASMKPRTMVSPLRPLFTTNSDSVCQGAFYWGF